MEVTVYGSLRAATGAKTVELESTPPPSSVGEALEAFLEAELGPAAEYDVRRHNQGHSNETLFVTWGDRDLVIRRPPPGETAETADDVILEDRVGQAG
jgi:hypothetical protein